MYDTDFLIQSIRLCLQIRELRLLTFRVIGNCVLIHAILLVLSFFSSSLHCLVSFSYGLLFCSLMEELMFLLSLQVFFKYFPQIWFSEHKFIQTISITKGFFLLKLWSLTSLYIVLWIGNCYLSDLKIPRASSLQNSS